MNRAAKYRFRLFVAGDAPNSALAVANLTTFCQANLPGRHEIAVVDVLRKPMLALAEGIFMTPTVVVLTPPPERRIVGTLSETRTLLMATGLNAAGG